MKRVSELFLVFILILWGSNTVRAQQPSKDAKAKKTAEVKQQPSKDDKAKKAAEVQRLVNGGRYTFKATEELSQGKTTAVANGHDMDIAKDTLIVYLPYLGAGPSEPVNPRAAGITCTHFSYKMVPGKNGHWDVTIRPKEKPGELKDVKEFKLDISSLGYTTMTVSRTDKSPITYYGYIMQHIAEFPNVSAQH